MKPERSSRDIRRMMVEGNWVDEALEAAAVRAIRMHRALGIPLAIWRDGKVVLVMADDLLPSERPKGL